MENKTNNEQLNNNQNLSKINSTNTAPKKEQNNLTNNLNKNKKSNFFNSAVRREDVKVNTQKVDNKNNFASINNIKSDKFIKGDKYIPMPDAVKIETPKFDINEIKKASRNVATKNQNTSKKRTSFSTEFLDKSKKVKQIKIEQTQKPDELLSRVNIHRPTATLKVMFLGGVGEIGKNMMALEYGNDIIIIDCGSTFPGDELPGIDLVVPDITYLVQNKDKIRGIVITHGHEDHIGSLPYVLNEIDVPVYGSRLANALIENKLREFSKIKANLINIKAKDVIRLGSNFKVEFIKVSHSIAGSMALAITTPAGVMVHTGDFKIDFSPIDGEMTDLARFAELGQQGVLLLTCESTNVEREGYSMSERTVGKTLDGLFEKYKSNRLFVATFASNIHRLQQILDLATKYKRKVVFTGRSMVNVCEVAYKVGELRYNKSNIIDIEKIANYRDDELLFITTGSQGEPMSALSRMASGEFQKIKLGENDCIIISASPIPGNEKTVNNVINRLYRLGCEVIYSSLADIHVSGHACREELKTIHAIVKPKYFMPVHGEFRHQKIHKNLAMELGMEERNIIMPELGYRVEITKNTFKNIGLVTAGKRLIDGLGVGDQESLVLKDRKQLSEDGLCVVVLGITVATGEITSGPDIISRGLIYNNEADNMVNEAKTVITDVVNLCDLKSTDFSIVKANIRRTLANYFFKKTKRRPMILTIILEN